MSTFLWIQLIITCFLGAVSPGPSLLLVVKNSISYGKTNGIITGIAHGLGIFIYAILTILGIAFLYTKYPILIKIISFILVLYLIYISYKLFYSEDEIDLKGNNKKKYNQNFTDGFMIAFLNPKITIFFGALFSQFINDELTNLENAIKKFGITHVDLLKTDCKNCEFFFNEKSLENVDMVKIETVTKNNTGKHMEDLLSLLKKVGFECVLYKIAPYDYASNRVFAHILGKKYKKL